MKRQSAAVLAALMVSGASALAAEDVPADQLERWFKSDELSVSESRPVDAGELEFIQQPPEEPLHHHHNTLVILPTSPDDGWVDLRQCHTNLDKVGAAQILFKDKRVRNLQVTEVRNMERAWVEGASVQMEHIRANAKLCLKAQTHALEQTGEGKYALRNGPFMRRFLDGYFPLRVSMDLFYGKSGLELVDFSPQVQPGFDVQRKPGGLHFDAVFEGRLVTEFQFAR